MKQFNPEDYLIFEAVVGSRLYGLANENSDLDLCGVCLPPIEILINPFQGFEVKDSGFEDDDRAIYDLGKFIQLCSQANPNIIELLFVPEEFTRTSSVEWHKVLDNKKYFLSKKVKHTFTGYAVSQLKRLERHRQWFLDPPKDKPKRKDYGLTDSPIISAGWMEALRSIPFEIIEEKYRDEIRREENYRVAKKNWDNYIHWVNNRNPKRKAMEEQSGYDLKFASHIFRLMSEGKELLLTGKITFPLPNAEEILKIKDGFYEYDEIIEEARKLEFEFEKWYELSELPMKPNINKLEELYFDIVLGENR